MMCFISCVKHGHTRSLCIHKRAVLLSLLSSIRFVNRLNWFGRDPCWLKIGWMVYRCLLLDIVLYVDFIVIYICSLIMYLKWRLCHESRGVMLSMLYLILISWLLRSLFLLEKGSTGILMEIWWLSHALFMVSISRYSSFFKIQCFIR
jgi:hypothetical protein